MTASLLLLGVELNLREEFLEIGLLTKAHGLGGELKLRLHHSESDALEVVTSVVLEVPGRKAQRYRLESVRGSGVPIVRLAGVTSRDDAEALRGAKVWVDRKALPLESGEYYLVDLVGAQVVYQGEVIGRVKSVRPDPTVDTLVMTLSDGTSAEQPLLDTWVGGFDSEANTLELVSDDGLLV